MASILKGMALVLFGAGLGYAASNYLKEPSGETPNPVLLTQPEVSIPATNPEPIVSAAQPILTLHQILEFASDFEQTAELYQLIRHMKVEGLNTLLDEAATINQVSQRVAAVSIIYARYGELDPKAAIERAISGSDQTENALVASIFHNWSRVDVEAAVSYAATLGKQAMQAAGAAILNARDDLSPIERQVIAETLNVKGFLDRIDLRNRSVAFATNPVGAWADALNIADPQQKIKILQSLSVLWAQKDPKAALAAIANLDDQRLNQANYQIAQVWAKKDADAALEWIITLPPGDQRTQLLNTTIGQVATTDLQRAITWADLQSDTDRRHAIQTIARSWLTQDIEAATTWLAELDDPGIYQNVLPSAAVMYANYSLDKAYQWVETLNEQQAVSALHMLVGNEARHNPLRSAQRISQYKDTPLWQSAANNLVQNWASQDPKAAMDWLNSQKDQDRAGIYQSLTAQWASIDSDAAIRALENIRDIDSHDAALVGVIQTLRESPIRAEELYEDIRGEAYKSQAAGILYAIWSQRDPKKAEKYIEPSKLAGLIAKGC